jgi:hypothetical protein
MPFNNSYSEDCTEGLLLLSLGSARSESTGWWRVIDEGDASLLFVSGWMKHIFSFLLHLVGLMTGLAMPFSSVSTAVI